MLENPIAAELDCMRPSVLPGLIEAAGRNARRGFPDCALFEIGPVFAGTEPADQRTAIAAIARAARSAPLGPRAGGRTSSPLKGDLMALLDELGAPVANLQVAQDGAAALVAAGPRGAAAAGPQGGAGRVRRDPSRRCSAALDVDGPIYALRGLGRGHPRAEEEGGEDAGRRWRSRR